MALRRRQKTAAPYAFRYAKGKNQMGHYDVQQVCLNGHQITDNYNRSPEFRKTHCNKCGEKTIHQCPECNHPIKGDYHVDGDVDQYLHSISRVVFSR